MVRSSCSDVRSGPIVGQSRNRSTSRARSSTGAAEGVVLAKRQGLIAQPTVVRLAGTGVAEGTRILDEATDVDIIRADGFAEAARKSVAAARGER